MNRRELLMAIAGGAIMTAEGLWMPGIKLISIPKKVFNPSDYITLRGNGLDDFIISSLLRKASTQIEIVGKRAKLTFPIIKEKDLKGLRPEIYSLYVGDIKVADFDVPLVAAPDIVVSVEIENWIPEIMIEDQK